MTGFARFGFWTCAALYAAAGVIGMALLSAQSSIAYSSDGYGTISAAIRQAAVTPRRSDAPKPIDASGEH